VFCSFFGFSSSLHSFASSFSIHLSIQLSSILVLCFSLSSTNKIEPFHYFLLRFTAPKLTPHLLLNLFLSLPSHLLLLQPCLRLTGKLTRCNFRFMFLSFYHFATWILCFLLNSSFGVLGFSQELDLCIVFHVF